MAVKKKLTGINFEDFTYSGRIPPQAVDVEEVVLGALLIEGKAYNDVAKYLRTKEVFYKDAHQQIFEAIVSCVEKSGSCDELMVTDTLRRSGKLEDVGGAYFVSQLTNKVVSSAHIQFHCAIIYEKYVAREILRMGMELIREAYDDTADIFTSLDNAVKVLDDVKIRIAAMKNSDLKKQIAETLKAIEEASRQKSIGYPTGLSNVDKISGGRVKGEFTLIAARPSMGKTSRIIQEILNMALGNDMKVGIISMEMTFVQLIVKMFSNISKIDSQLIRGGNLDDSQWKNLVSSSGRLSESNIFINDVSDLTVTEIRSIIRAWVEVEGVEIVYIDYIGLVKFQNLNGKPVDEISKISRGLKTIAPECGVPVIALAQLNREVERRADKHPMLSDLRDCLPKGQLVYVNGERIPIEKCKPEMEVVSFGKARSLQIDRIKNIWESGIKKIYKITTDTGRVLECSDGHKFFATTFKTTNVFAPNQRAGLAGWTELKKLKVGQKIAIVKQYPELQTKNKISPNLALILGWIVGDGHVHKKGYCEVTLETYSEALLFKGLIDNEMGADCSISKYPTKKCYRLYVAYGRTRISGGNNFAKFLLKIGMDKIGKNKGVPLIIFNQSKDVIGAFLSGLFHSDGCIVKRNKTNSPTIKFNTISKQLAEDVIHLLARIGIIGSIKKVSTKNNGYPASVEYAFVVYITGVNLLKFGDLCGFLLHKKEKYDLVMKGYVPKVREKKMDIFFDRIKSIEYIGEKETFDIEVYGHHSSRTNNSFCVNEFLTHNSGALEQDADVITFLYRPEYYGILQDAEGNSTVGVCEEMILKNRNGAIGNTRHIYKKETSEFTPLPYFESPKPPSYQNPSEPTDPKDDFPW